jgi:adenine deaminase
VGSIEVGKSADLVLFDKHPLSGFSKAQKVWIDGHEYFDREKEIETRPEFEKKKKALQDKEAAAAPPGRRRTGAGTGESNPTATNPNWEEAR